MYLIELHGIALYGMVLHVIALDILKVHWIFT